MRLKLADVAVVFVYTPFVGSGAGALIASCPFTEHSCSISVVFHYFRQYDVLRIVWMLPYYRVFFIVPIHHGGSIFPIFFVSPHFAMTAVLPRHDWSSWRCADRATGIRLCEEHPFICHSVDMRGADKRLTVAGQISISHVIAENK